jgi:hypothetical protein
MAYTVNDDTDVEMTRYNEAADIKKYSGVSIDNVRGGYVQHDPIRKVEGVYIDLPSGGKLRVGDRPVQVAQADTMLTQTDATAAPAALVPTAAPKPVSLRPTAMAAAPAAAPQTIAEYDAQLRATSDRAPTAADFEGNYTAEEIATLSANPEMVPMKMTPAQTAEYAKQPGAMIVSDYETPGLFEGTVSEVVKGLVRGGIVEPAKFVNEMLGDTRSTFFQLVNPKTGEFEPRLMVVSAEEMANIMKMPFAPVGLEDLLKTDEQAGTGAQIAGGVGQFVGAFAGVGKLFKIGKGLLGAATQGAAADFLGFGGNDGRLTDVLLELGVPENRVTDFLRTDPSDPDYVGRFKNALEGAILGGLVDQIAPVFRLIKDGGSATALGQAIGDLRFKAQQTSSNLLSDAIGVGRAVAAGDTRMLGEIFQPAGTPRSLGAAAPTDLEAAPAFTPEIMARLVTAPEMAAIARDVPVEKASDVAQKIARQKSAFGPENGWAELAVTKVKVNEFNPPKRKEAEPDVAYAARVEAAREKHEDTFEVSYKEIPYNFDKPPEGVSQNAWQQTMVQRQVDEVRALADRVRAKDPKAIAIVQQANWYRTMRASLRKEFGGIGDVFADVLGATSAQTGVELNWNNSIEVMRRFSRGEFDEEIRMYDEMLQAGNVNPTTLGQMHKDPNNPFRLITSAAGALFNINSPAATKALFDMFRVATGAPKTPNFTGNLIGYTNAATVDVWDARHLRRLAGLDRIPPPAEAGVVGVHLEGSTLEQPNVSGEFGFGQRVKAAAADEINKQGIISSVAPNLQAMNPDDLQAVAWFIEKEIWTENGWTTKAGEGGSFEFESSLAGAADPALAKTLRRRVTESFKPPMMRKKDTADSYAARVEALRAEHVAGAAEAQKQLDEIKAPLARYVLGISVERPGLRPTNVQQADVAARLGEPAKADPSVVTYQINNTYGRFMQSDERAFNAEFVVRQNFNPEGVTRRMVEVAKEADQDAAFISKVVSARTAESRPGVEIYFRKRQDPDFARRLSDKLTQYGVDGFTFVTDSRVMDRPSAQAGLATEAVAGINGLRFQYIPEFDMGADAWAAMSPAEKATKIDEVEDLFDDITRDIVKTEPGISAANLMHYETNVIEKGKYDEYLK